MVGGTCWVTDRIHSEVSVWLGGACWVTEGIQSD